MSIFEVRYVSRACRLVAPGFVALLVACSTAGGGEEDSSSEWFECRAGKSGEAWVCGSGEDSGSGAPAATGEQLPVAAGRTIPEAEAEEAVAAEPAEMEPAAIDSSEPVARPSGYSIQLAAFRSVERRDRYVESLALSANELILGESEEGGQRWWLVLYGDYASLAEAQAAQARLRRDFGVEDSWIKPARTSW